MLKRDLTFGGHVGAGLEMDDATYRRVYRRIGSPVFWVPTMLAVASIPLACGTVAQLWMLQLGPGRVPPVLYPTVMIAQLATAGFVAIVAQSRILRWRVRRVLRRFGFAVCEGCGYVMTGLSAEAACPECGGVSDTMVEDLRS